MGVTEVYNSNRTRNVLKKVNERIKLLQKWKKQKKECEDCKKDFNLNHLWLYYEKLKVITKQILICNKCLKIRKLEEKI